MADRHLEILKLLLEGDSLTLEDLTKKTYPEYRLLNNPYKALVRDVNYLLQLGALRFEKLQPNGYRLFARLEWPTEVTETEFFARVKQMPKAKTHSFLD
jgi:hypothetical protein